MKTFFIFIAVLVGVGAAVLYIQQSTNLFGGPDEAVVQFSGASVRAEVVNTSDKQYQGLSGRDSLPADRGMLFVFDEADYHGFTMRDMKFAIDIIWFDESQTVVDVTPQLDPTSYPSVFKPYRPAKYVLEVPAGFVQDHGITIGDRASFDYL